ncbi:hypothetical protein ACMXYX_18040 (plasmid) [Neptuniibacter sp. QD72_48]|uniref:hypothetical protein n=1 Tax=Neptuniibacter sp. QD72_48 TaxID=3398214 RepID=UPI0039F63041
MKKGFFTLTTVALLTSSAQVMAYEMPIFKNAADHDLSPQSGMDQDATDMVSYTIDATTAIAPQITRLDSTDGPICGGIMGNHMTRNEDGLQKCTDQGLAESDVSFEDVKEIGAITPEQQQDVEDGMVCIRGEYAGFVPNILINDVKEADTYKMKLITGAMSSLYELKSSQSLYIGVAAYSYRLNPYVKLNNYIGPMSQAEYDLNRGHKVLKIHENNLGTVYGIFKCNPVDRRYSLSTSYRAIYAVKHLEPFLEAAIVKKLNLQGGIQ